MSAIPPGLPEPIPSQDKPPVPRGRDRALSSTPPESKKQPPAPPPLPPAPAEAAPAPVNAYEYGASNALHAQTAPAFALSSSLSSAPSLVRNHLLAWFIVLAIVGVALAVTIPFTVGVYFGNQDRAAYVDRQAQEHFQRALAYESETYNQLAIAELELALQYKPDYEPARTKLEQLKTVHTEIIEQEPQDVVIAKQLYESADQAFVALDWNNAIDLFEELRRVKSDYRVSQVDAKLVEAYLAAGKQALLGNDVDLARRRFEAALALDPNNAAARTQRERALLYFTGVSYMGSNWPSAVATLAELYSRDSNFGDVAVRLREAHIGYGGFASDQGAYCIAAREFDEALVLGAGTETQIKYRAANDACKNAILNPTATLTPTPEGGFATPDPFATPNPFATPRPGATGAGVLYAPGSRVRQNALCNGTGDIRGTVKDAQGNPIPNVGVKIYNDFGYLPPFARTDPAGEYQIALGSDKGVFHLVIVDDFGSNASAVFDVDYPGGNVQGCHIVVNWTRIK